jgi:hypothetical protein
VLVGNLWPCLPRRRARLNGESVVEITERNWDKAPWSKIVGSSSCIHSQWLCLVPQVARPIIHSASIDGNFWIKYS